MKRFSSGLCIGLVALSAIGCNTDQSAGPRDSGNTAYTAGHTGPSSSDTASGTQLPSAGFINSVPFKSTDLQTSLYELAGGQILAEVVTDRLIAQQLQDRKLAVTPEMVEHERQLLLTNINPDANQAQRLLNELRDRRGLGDFRFNALLNRNAGLRLLIQDRVKIEVRLVDQEYMLLYGPRSEIRLIVTSNLPVAGEVIRRAKAGDSFSDLAIQLSTDISKAQGGLLSPISVADETYPKAIRDAADRLKPGQISDPIALDQGFAIIKLERKIEGAMPKMEDVKKDLEARVRIRSERLLMEQEARTLIRQADVVVLDPALQKSWNLQRSRMIEGAKQ